MMKLIGCILTAGASAYLGFCMAARLKKRIQVLGELAEGFLILEQELELSARELDELMYRAGSSARGAAKKLFSEYAASLTNLGAMTAGQLWEREVNSIEYLIPEAAQCVGLLSGIMGRYECEQQRIAVASVRARLEYLRAKEESQCTVRCRTCQTIGISGGAFLVILLL